MKDLLNHRNKTIHDFDDQWLRNPDNNGYYGSINLLDDLLNPFLSRKDIVDKHCADIGSGTGRIVLMLVEAGAKHVTAVEPSHAFMILKQNTKNISESVTCLNIRGDELPVGDFSLITSIGVIHHIPEPLPVIEAAYRALKPGGQLLIWFMDRRG